MNFKKEKDVTIILVIIITLLINMQIPAQQNEPYMIPRRIYIGDPAVLVVPLSGLTDILSAQDIVLTAGSPDFPSHPDIDFHRIILEHRAGTNRLVIEFSAFVPGTLELPVIKIGGENFSGLAVTVSSLIEDRSSVILSAPASSLAMPGTALLLYGSITALVFIILLTAWFALKGRVFFNKWCEKWKRRMLFVSIKRTEKRLYRAVLKEENKRLILDKLSEEMRSFLSRLTGINCFSMTAAEFPGLPLELPLPSAALSAASPADNQAVKTASLQGFFRSCDELRFSGDIINSDSIFRLLADLRSFLQTLESSLRENNKKVKSAEAEG